MENRDQSARPAPLATANTTRNWYGRILRAPRRHGEGGSPGRLFECESGVVALRTLNTSHSALSSRVRGTGRITVSGRPYDGPATSADPTKPPCWRPQPETR